ncbi:MAG: hypothetical protein COV66_15115 [Nitrospinae bacterium CG11_big_fil_rev_8_21_14_0_20_45_15]|nr:MAG: hypothetical protein COV66_15115 [Nitrospinae bacterium CG11_big_fil_rev_8_21_14_0_20_45_15]
MKANKLSIWIGTGFLLMLPLFYIDYSDTEYPALQKAEQVVRHVSSQRHLKHSSFYALDGEKTPSRFVQWMFSTLAHAEWYLVDAPGEFNAEELKMIKKSGIPLIPPEVAIVPYKPDLERGKQVVVKADNTRNILVVESYIDPQMLPVRTREWEFSISDKE